VEREEEEERDQGRGAAGSCFIFLVRREVAVPAGPRPAPLRGEVRPLPVITMVVHYTTIES